MKLTVFVSSNPSPEHAKFARLQAQKMNAGLPNTKLMRTSNFPAVKKKKKKRNITADVFCTFCHYGDHVS